MKSFLSLFSFVNPAALKIMKKELNADQIKSMLTITALDKSGTFLTAMFEKKSLIKLGKL